MGQNESVNKKEDEIWIKEDDTDSEDEETEETEEEEEENEETEETEETEYDEDMYIDFIITILKKYKRLNAIVNGNNFHQR